METTFEALSHQLRLDVLDRLRRGPSSVTVLLAELGVGQPRVARPARVRRPRSGRPLGPRQRAYECGLVVPPRRQREQQPRHRLDGGVGETRRRQPHADREVVGVARSPSAPASRRA